MEFKFFEVTEEKLEIKLTEKQLGDLNGVMNGEIRFAANQLEQMRYKGFNPADFRERVIKALISKDVKLESLVLLATSGGLIGNKPPGDNFSENFKKGFAAAVKDITAKGAKVVYSEPNENDVTPARLMLCMPVAVLKARIAADSFCQVVVSPGTDDLKAAGINMEWFKYIANLRWIWHSSVVTFLEDGKYGALVRVFWILSIKTTEVLRRKKKESSNVLRSAIETSSGIFANQIGSNRMKLDKIPELAALLAPYKEEKFGAEEKKAFDEHVKDLIERIAPKKSGKKE